MKNLGRHTIVIPTYNRPDLLLQLVRYYQNEASPMPLLVLDSSAADIAHINQERCASFGSPVIYRNYAPSLPMAEKLAQGLSEIVTPTVSFCADDDVVFPKAIDQSISFLNQASDFVCSHGLYVNFQVQAPQVRVTREYGGEGNLAQHAGARIFRLCQNYESLLYAVFRTQDLQQIFAGVRNIPTLHFQELLQSVAALILGKANRFATFYAGRRAGPEAEPSRDKWQTYYWFADNPTDMVQHYGDYRRASYTFYQKFGAPPLLPEEVFMRVFDIAHSVFFAGSLSPDYLHHRLQDLWPEDPFIKKQADLFEKLRGTKQETILSATIKYLSRMQARRHAGGLSALARINKSIANNYGSGQHQQPWHCDLPPEFTWLAKSVAFSDSFRELCRYLDCA